MRKYKCIAVLILALAACNKVAPEQDTVNGLQEMSFEVGAAIMTRGDGIYNESTYPVRNLNLTAVYHDGYSGENQEFFHWMPLNEGNDGLWKAQNWYWPLQGDMAFISYYCPGYSAEPQLDTVRNSNGNLTYRMLVDPSSALNGKTDFLYLAQDGVACRRSGPASLTFVHGLAWITVSIQARVYDEGSTNVNTSLTQEVVNSVRVNKIVIEDCARKGSASIVAGKDIVWTIDPDRIRDQIYYKHGSSSLNMNQYSWAEMRDGSQFVVNSNFSLPTDLTELGSYTTSDEESYIGSGLLIVPQSKTAITVYYTVTVGTQTFNKLERFELRDNEDQWRPGHKYEYKIIFKNYDETASGIDLVEEWSYIRPDENLCYGTGAYAGMDIYVGGVPVSSGGGFIINHLHDGGSGLNTDMDYFNGGAYY